MITRVHFQILRIYPMVFLLIFHENRHYLTGHFQEIRKNHIKGEFMKIWECTLVIIFLIFPLKWRFRLKNKSFEISRNSPYLYRLLRNSDQMTIGKTQPTLKSLLCIKQCNIYCIFSVKMQLNLSCMILLHYMIIYGHHIMGLEMGFWVPGFLFSFFINSSRGSVLYHLVLLVSFWQTRLLINRKEKTLFWIRYDFTRIFAWPLKPIVNWPLDRPNWCIFK